MFHQIVVVNDVTDLEAKLKSQIRTSPSKRALCNSTAIPICGDNKTNCNCKSSNKYVIKNIMLGQEIISDASILDYYDRPANGEQFFVTIKNSTYSISDSPKFISISDRLEGIKIIGKMFPIKLTLLWALNCILVKSLIGNQSL